MQLLVKFRRELKWNAAATFSCICCTCCRQLWKKTCRRECGVGQQLWPNSAFRWFTQQNSVGPTRDCNNCSKQWDHRRSGNYICGTGKVLRCSKYPSQTVRHILVSQSVSQWHTYKCLSWALKNNAIIWNLKIIVASMNCCKIGNYCKILFYFLYYKCW